MVSEFASVLIPVMYCYYQYYDLQLVSVLVSLLAPRMCLAITSY